MLARTQIPYRTPRAAEPLRLAFVGQATFFEACALHADAGSVRTRFVDFREGADAEGMRAELDAFAPHVVAVFRPEIVPAGTFAGLRATTLGFLTEPIPRVAGHKVHPDLRRRRSDLRKADASQFDRVVSFDPMIAPTAAQFFGRVWRSLPIPVADRFYAPVPDHAQARMLFVGRSTPHRERFLRHPKHELDVLHVAFGAGAEELDELMRSHDVAVNVHNEPYPSFENRVCLHLAAGHLVVSETLSPTHGLEPGIDYLEVSEPEEMLALLRAISASPDAFHRVRVRGRRKAESFRASRVWPALAHDLLGDVAAFGTERTL